MVGEIGLKNTEFLPDIVPVLIDVLDDDTPAVVRQAILCGIGLFRSTLQKIAIQVSPFFFFLLFLTVNDFAALPAFGSVNYFCDKIDDGYDCVDVRCVWCDCFLL